MIIEKFCPYCEELKLTTEFYTCKHMVSGYKAKCITCSTKANRDNAKARKLKNNPIIVQPPINSLWMGHIMTFGDSLFYKNELKNPRRLKPKISYPYLQTLKEQAESLNEFLKIKDENLEELTLND